MPEFILDESGSVKSNCPKCETARRGIAIAMGGSAHGRSTFYDCSSCDGHGVQSRQFSDLDEFTQGYIEAMFFCECTPLAERDEFETPEFQHRIEEGTSDGTIPADSCFGDIHPTSLESIIEDCREFQEKNREGLEQACDIGRIDGYNMRRAGNDFWYTRNGHGTGFWDRDEIGDFGDKLADAARPWRELYVCWSDGKVHVE